MFCRSAPDANQGFKKKRIVYDSLVALGATSIFMLPRKPKRQFIYFREKKWNEMEIEGNLCYQNHRNCCLLVEHLLFVADKTVSDWRRILSYLGIDENIIRAVEEDAASRNIINDSREVAYQGYLKWKNINPEKASFCTLQNALAKAQRNDISKVLKEKYHFAVRRSVQRHNSFRSPVNHFVGREKETDKVVAFCNDEASEHKLLLLYGLPGVGKTELLQQALNIVINKSPSLEIIKPVFTVTNGGAHWGLEDIAASILEELQHVYINFRVAALHKVLVSITKPTLLILEVCGLNFKTESLVVFWSFLNSLLRSENKFLKIIVTSYKSPDISFLQNIHVEEVHLKGLSQTESFQLLRSMNPRISTMYCQRIFERCGSHPFILRKISAHIKNFHSNEKELKSFVKALDSKSQLDVLQPMLSTPIMKYDMKIVFDELEHKEKVALVKLCGFPEIIPVDALDYIFGSALYHTCNHLCLNHCIIEKSGSGNYFKMNLLTRTFIKSFAESDRELNATLLEAREEITKYYLDLVKSLDEIYHYPNVLSRSNHCLQLVSEYRDNCTVCPEDCICPTSKVIKYLFLKRKTQITRAFQQGLQMKNLFYDTVQTCSQVVHFLRYVVCYEDLLELYDEIFVKLETKGEKVLMAITMANLVFIKVYTKVLKDKDENIMYLSKSITLLEHNQQFTGVTETLIHCYMKRGYLKSFCPSTYDQGMPDISRACSLTDTLSSSDQRELLQLVFSGYISAVYYRQKKYKESIREREKQILGYRKHFDVHTYTAKVMHYQGQAFGKIGKYNDAISCCMISYEINRTLNGEGVETMRVLSTLGKLYIKAGKVDLGFKKLDYAKNVAENALGDHDRVAWCYEQFARLKKAHGFKEEGEELELRAEAMRKNFELKSMVLNMKKYSLQMSREVHLAHDFDSLTKSEENTDQYVQVVFFLMLVAIIWRLFEIFYTCNCDRF